MLNKIMLIGNVGSEPNVRTLDTGVKVATIRRATSEKYKTADGQTKEQTEWHTIELWRNLADIADKWVKKGDRLYIEGAMHYKSYTDKEGVERIMASITATELRMLTAKNEKCEEEKDAKWVQPQKPQAVELPPQPADEMPF